MKQGRPPPDSGTSPRAAPGAEAPEALFSPAHCDALFDIDALERDLDVFPAEGGVAAAPRGSMSLCNSRSAEAFRKSGRYAAVARASVRRDMKRGQDEGKGVTGGRRESAATVPSGGEGRLVVTKRGAMKGRGYKMETAVPRTRGEDGWSPVGMVRRHSEARRSGRLEEAGVRTVLMNKREGVEMRERDENDFRMSNAKLPERVEQTGSRRADWAKFRRGRNSTPILGRYTRSRSSQLPPRGSPRRPFQAANSSG